MKSYLNLGTMIKLWHDSRGHDYVFVGVDTARNKALFIKANCINSGGVVRSNTTRFHKELNINSLGKTLTVKRVTRVIGTKPLEANTIEAFIQRIGAQNVVIAKKNKPIYSCLPNLDARHSALYIT